jgi:hypothetical protein
MGLPRDDFLEASADPLASYVADRASRSADRGLAMLPQ